MPYKRKKVIDEFHLFKLCATVETTLNVENDHNYNNPCFGQTSLSKTMFS